METKSSPHPKLPGGIKNVLFVCTGNCARSVMAAAIFTHLAEEAGLSTQAESAGTDAKPGIKPTAHTIKLLQEHHIPHLDHQAQKCTPELVEKADVIFVMEMHHQKKLLAKHPELTSKIFLLADFGHGVEPWIQQMGIPDPMGMSFSFYENIYRLIDGSCRNIVTHIKNSAS